MKLPWAEGPDANEGGLDPNPGRTKKDGTLEGFCSPGWWAAGTTTA